MSPNSSSAFPDSVTYARMWFVLEFKVPECIKIHWPKISLGYALGEKTESSEIHTEK